MVRASGSTMFKDKVDVSQVSSSQRNGVNYALFRVEVLGPAEDADTNLRAPSAASGPNSKNWGLVSCSDVVDFDKRSGDATGLGGHLLAALLSQEVSSTETWERV
eukprot:3116700-Rhodomonas_salina.1